MAAPQVVAEPPLVAEDVVSFFGGVADEAQPAPRAANQALTPGVTVGVCTFKRPAGLSRFLDSLRDHDYQPDSLVIVDASPDDATERMLRQRADLGRLAKHLLYFRVRGQYDSLTAARNFAIRFVATDLVVFFDDDVVLLPHCIREMEQTHRAGGDQVVGVGAVADNQMTQPTLHWRIRRWLGIVPSLRPGAYTRSGMSIPWDFLPRTEEVVEGQWLGGLAMMWKTAVAREVRFNERFANHSIGEDLDFGLRAGAHGKVLQAGKARVLHLPELSGRANAYMVGYTSVLNAYRIHQECLPKRTWLDTTRFMYAWGLDTLLQLVVLLRPGPRLQRWRFLRGRLWFFVQWFLKRGKV